MANFTRYIRCSELKRQPIRKGQVHQDFPSLMRRLHSGIWLVIYLRDRCSIIVGLNFTLVTINVVNVNLVCADVTLQHDNLAFSEMQGPLLTLPRGLMSRVTFTTGQILIAVQHKGPNQIDNEPALIFMPIALDRNTLSDKYHMKPVLRTALGLQPYSSAQERRVR